MGTVLTTPQLIIHEPTGATAVHLAGQTRWTVGRAPGNDIILKDYAVSRNHATIERQGPNKFVVTDLGSGNGSFVKGQRILSSHALQHGDRMTMGRIQLEFQRTFDDDPLRTQIPRRTVLMMHTSALQAKVWQEVFASQRIAVAHLNRGINLQALITQRAAQQDLPDLLLLDMAGFESNPYHFCRWCRDTYPEIKVILMNSKRLELSPSECKWAIHQGAVDLLPGFPEAQLFNNLTRITKTVQLVLQALDWPEIEHQLLLETLFSIQTLKQEVLKQQALSRSGS